MRNGAIDYSAVIRDLEQKRAQMNAQFDSAISAIRNIVAAMQQPDTQPSLLGLTQTFEAAKARYRGGSMVDMAIQHLARAGRAVPNMELAKALDEAGFPHKSKNFPNTLNSILHRRAKTVGDLRKTAEGWQLAQQ